MRRWLLLPFVVLLLLHPGSLETRYTAQQLRLLAWAERLAAQETLTLTTPVAPLFPPTTTYAVRRVLLAWDEAFIYILVRDNNGVSTPAIYSGAAATALMRALNTADLSTMSLHRRILQQLVKDGKLPAGTVTGIPE